MGMVGTRTFGRVGNLSLSLFGHCTIGTPVRANLGSLLASSSSKILLFLVALELPRLLVEVSPASLFCFLYWKLC